MSRSVAWDGAVTRQLLRGSSPVVVRPTASVGYVRIEASAGGLRPAQNGDDVRVPADAPREIVAGNFERVDRG